MDRDELGPLIVHPRCGLEETEDHVCSVYPDLHRGLLDVKVLLTSPATTTTKYLVCEVIVLLPGRVRRTVIRDQGSHGSNPDESGPPSGDDQSSVDTHGVFVEIS